MSRNATAELSQSDLCRQSDRLINGAPCIEFRRYVCAANQSRFRRHRRRQVPVRLLPRAEDDVVNLQHARFAIDLDMQARVVDLYIAAAANHLDLSALQLRAVCNRGYGHL